MSQVKEMTKRTGANYSMDQVEQWRSQVDKQRHLLFNRNWKNSRQSTALKSKKQVESFTFLLEWCEEFNDVIGREKERNRLDTLKEMGLDVNAPHDPALLRNL